MWPDIKIFRDSLITFLEDGERVEADDGYIGEAPDKVKCPASFVNLLEIWRCKAVFVHATKLATRDSSGVGLQPHA